jgi:hypothetical protein
MIDTNSTKPPYHAQQGDEKGVWVIKPIPGQIVGEAYDKATAKLFAAAPDLLDAATALYKNAFDREETHDYDGDERDGWKQLKAAIRKAGGKV